MSIDRHFASREEEGGVSQTLSVRYTYFKGADKDTNSDTQRYTAKKKLSKYPEYLRDSYVLLPSLPRIIPFAHSFRV